MGKQMDVNKEFRFVTINKNDRAVHVKYSSQGKLTLFSKSLMEELTEVAEAI